MAQVPPAAAAPLLAQEPFAAAALVVPCAQHVPPAAPVVAAVLAVAADVFAPLAEQPSFPADVEVALAPEVLSLQASTAYEAPVTATAARTTTSSLRFTMHLQDRYDDRARGRGKDGQCGNGGLNGWSIGL
jgi:hypothetical protein